MAEFDPSTARPEGEFDPSTATPYTPPKSGIIRRGIGDTALAVGQGAVGAVKSIADATGANNRVSRTLGELNEGMQGLLSPERQAEMQSRAAIIDEADKSGSTLDQVTSRLGGLVEAPVQTVAQGIGSIVPTVAAALATRGRSLGAQIGASTAVGGVMGVGGVKGQNYEAVLREATARGLPPAEAEALAQRAAEYSAENAPQQILAGGLGALAGTTGAERIVRGVVSGDGLTRRIVKGALAEGVPEGAQGAQAQYAQNVALNQAGFQTDTSTGVLGQGLLEGLVGGVIGGALGVPKQDAPPAPAPAQPAAPGQPPAAAAPPASAEPAAPPADAPAAPPVTGPLTAAVSAMTPKAIDAGIPPLPTGQAQELDGEQAARVQREATRPAEPTGAILPGDITRDGKPFTSMESASRALAKAGPGHELARVTGGLVVRPIGATPAAPAQRRPAAQGGPLAQFAAENAQDNADDLLLAGRNTLPGMRTGGVDTRELSLEEAQAMIDPPAAAPEKRIPTGKATELPVETVEPAAPPPPEVRREPRTPKPQATRGMTDADVVRAYVEQRRNEGTLAGRRFAGDFDAGRITPEDVLALVRPRAEPTADERLAAAAGQRPTPAPAPGLVDAQGRPIPTTIRERREQQRQPDLAAATRSLAGPGDGRGDNPGGSGVPVGSVPAAPGGVVQPAAGAGAGRGAADAVADGGGADAALTDPRQQDSRGLRESDRRARDVGGAAQELASQIQGDIAENDFAPDEVLPGLELFAKQANVPADDLRQEVLARLRKSGMRQADIKRVERALDPTKRPAAAPDAAAPAPQAPPQGRAPEAAAPASQPVAEAPDPAAPQPAPAPQVSTQTDAPAPAPEPAPTNPPAPAAQTRPERLIELRKRQSVLKQLLECLG